VKTLNKRIVLVVLAVIIIFTVAYGAYSLYQINNPEVLFNNSTDNSPVKEDEQVPEKKTDEDNKEPERKEPVLSEKAQPEKEEEEPYKFDSERVNILLLGIDASTERYETMKAFRTDTIMLVSISFNSETVHIISIPRDSYVEIPGQERREKINAAFVRGGGFKGKGFEKTMQTVSKFLGGVPVHYYVAVDMNVVKDIIDIMGGLDYEVDIEVNLGGRKLEKGFQHLDGQQVLDYVRTRHTSRGDIDRIGRQQKIVLAVFDQLKSTKQITKIPQFYSAISERIHTNLNLKQIAALALFGTKLEMADIETHTISGGSVNLGGISYWGVNQQEKKELVSQIFGLDIEIDPTLDVEYLKKMMAEEREKWMEIVHKGQEAVNAGRRTLAAYVDGIKNEDKQKMENHINLILGYIEDGDAEGIEREVEELYKHNNSILPSATETHRAIQRANAVLNSISSKTQTYQEFLLKEEKAGLQEKEEKVRQAIASKEVQNIEQAVTSLKNYADMVFGFCEQRKNQQQQEIQEKPPQDEQLSQEKAIEQEETKNLNEQTGQQQ